MAMPPDLLESLNPDQRAAVEYCSGPQLVIAGAGSGKTRVLTYKIAYLLQQGVAPDSIMALTFTNKAAREMKERIASLVGPRASALWMGTFHSILLRLLRLHADRLGFRYDFTIYDQTDSRSLVKLIVAELGLDDKQYRPASVASAISNIKNRLISPERYAADTEAAKADNHSGHPMLASIYKMYRDRCRTAQAMDFDDILYYANVLLRDNEDLAQLYGQRFQYILVDEYQDTNFAQSLIVNRLTQLHRRLCVVGDDAQSIYAFRGANIANILDMGSRWPDLKLFKLERNYRSTQTIVQASGSLIAHNREQIPKKVYSKNEVGEKIEVTQAFSDYEEAALLAAAVSRRSRISGGSLEDMAVLYRTNAQSRTLEEALRRRAIPYRIYGGLTFYQRKEVKDALAYFRLSVNPDDDEALRRVINLPARGIGATTMNKVRSLAMDLGMSMYKVVRDPEAVNLNVNKGTAAKLRAFGEMIQRFNSQTSRLDAYALGRDIYNATGLASMYAHASTPEEVSKQENLNELLSGLKEFVETRPTDLPVLMGSYLSEVSLLTDQDAKDDADEEKLTLMTVHAAKGLEFNHVFITGLEENLFPGSQALENPAELEEERRLLYVALTRARKSVWLSYANQRFRNGQTMDTIPSRFISEIDPQYLKGDLPQFRRHVSQSTTPYRHQMQSRIEQPPQVQQRSYSTMEPPRNLLRMPRRTLSEKSATPQAANVSKTSINAPYKPGQKVNHAKFGNGTVVTYHENPEPMVEVDFDDFGQKKLILRFATLNRIE